MNGHYRSNLRDMDFVLFELLDSLERYGQAPFGDMDRAAARTVLAEAERYATVKLAPTFSDVDREPLAFDPETHSVRLPKAFREAAHDYLASGWLDLDLPPTEAGEAVPPSLRWCVTELMLGANPPIPMGLNVIPQVVRLLLTHGTEDQRRLAELIREKRWMVTMVLTEPDAGSDVGAARTRAHPQADGSWHLEGIKRFITYGDHDLSDNIVHMVLARPVGVEGVGGPGTRGLSLFVVPKFHVDLTSGECLGRNGVKVTGLERKLGLGVNPTCEVTFGDGTPAVGWLLGDSHLGITQMFEIIKHVRMLVGVKAMATLSTGYLNALDYAKTRVQGAPIVRGPSPEPVAIVEHPDVRRSLLSQKAHAEGMRALILYAASQQDKLQASQDTGEADRDADARHQLLLPVIKGYCSEVAWRLLGQESLQVFGGSGYLKDYPLEQYVRDTKVDTLYEGTTGIQGLDLVGRKIVRDRRTLDGLLDDIAATVATDIDGFASECALLRTALADFEELTTLVVSRWEADGPDGRAVAAQNCTRLLLCLGDLVVGWLSLRGCAVADTALAGATAKERDFYLGKIASGRWFLRNVLPQISAALVSARHASPEFTELPASAL